MDRALARWCALQPDMVPFTGRCLVHRAEIMQFHGAWADALARRARGRAIRRARNPAEGLARYRQGEVLRLQGDFAGAEAAYREASARGWEPQPGLAQLRLAQGARGGGSAIRRAEASHDRAARARDAAPGIRRDRARRGDVADARQACDELDAIAARYASPVLGAISGQALGAVALAEGDPARRSRRSAAPCDLAAR